jgi:hypothetical protein
MFAVYLTHAPRRWICTATLLAAVGCTHHEPSGTLVPESILNGKPTPASDSTTEPPATPASRDNQPSNEADAIAAATTAADFVVPTSAPTGAAVMLPRRTRHVGEKRRLLYATGGGGNVERDRYEVIETVKGMTGPVVTEVDYEVLSSSMSAFSGHSSLHDGYTARGGPRDPTTHELHLTYVDRSGKVQEGLAVEELDALTGDQVGQASPPDALFSTVALRVGEVIKLTDDQEALLVGQPIPTDVFLTRLPDRAGRFVAVMLVELADGGTKRKSRVTFEYDAATGFLRRGIQLIVTEMKGSDGRVNSTTFVVLNEYEPVK